MSKKPDKTVVRNAAYSIKSVDVRERHNERKNETYYNADIDPARSHLNVHFCRYQFPDGTPVTYEQRFNQLLAAGTIVKRGLKDGANVIDELVYDVNTAYFEENGGYEFAKKFYEEAYRLAVKEVGSEDYILSAVMHADEKNVSLSEQLGRDVYHYHLHVMYVPVVPKEVLWSKRCKDPSLVGTVKEVIPQISHSKKWPKEKQFDENGEVVRNEKGKAVLLNSYSLLQDRFFEGMRAAGYDNIERGERGSTAEHLSVIAYKVQQEQKRLAALEKQAEKKEKRLAKLDEQITVKEKAKATLAEVDTIGKPALLGGVNFTDDEAKKLKSLAKKGVGVDKRAEEYKNKITTLEGDIRSLNSQISDWQQSYHSVSRDRDTWKANYERLWSEVKDFIGAIRRMPQKLLGFIQEHLPKSHDREAR